MKKARRAFQPSLGTRRSQHRAFKPSVIYTLIESNRSAFVRSADAAKTWEEGDRSSWMCGGRFILQIVDRSEKRKQIVQTDLVLIMSEDAARASALSSGRDTATLHECLHQPGEYQSSDRRDDGRHSVFSDG